MKVRELIEKLQQYDGDLDVVTEGCDCMGDAHDVMTNREFYANGAFAETNREANHVVITRSEGREERS